MLVYVWSIGNTSKQTLMLWYPQLLVKLLEIVDYE